MGRVLPRAVALERRGEAAAVLPTALEEMVALVSEAHREGITAPLRHAGKGAIGLRVELCFPTALASREEG